MGADTGTDNVDKEAFFSFHLCFRVKGTGDDNFDKEAWPPLIYTKDTGDDTSDDKPFSLK